MSRRIGQNLMAERLKKVVEISHWRDKSRKQVLEQLFRDHGAALSRFLRGRFGPDVELDDLVQDVFVWLASRDDLYHKISPESGSNRSLLFTVINSMAVDRERHKKVQQRFVLEGQQFEDDQELQPSPDQILEKRQQLEHVHRVIMNLRPNWRRVFILSRFEHKSYRQIAEEMGVSVKQIEKYMSNALKEIRTACKGFRSFKGGSKNEY
ncbi:sigma-70 family RNA polymerase sigma factor [Porticoccaceae bacterium LTM1]|nr:sigma-70 family RNA polymerase sigma factor [Porticoccaceae bacterium LTM1]